MREFYRTADLHLGHDNIWLPDYANRPYHSTEEMNEALIENWNATVRPRDNVTIHGDACMGKIVDSLALIARLNGYKVLLCGNHDRPWAGHSLKRRKGWLEKYYAAGFDLVVPRGQVYEFRGSKKVLSTHFPYEGDSLPNDRYSKHRPPDRGEWLLHGHVHEAWKQNGRMINVGVDVWDFTPVHVDTLFALMT